MLYIIDMIHLNFKPHNFQKKILAKLANAPKLRFSELQIYNLESEHMNYHLQKLIEIGLVIKLDNHYLLTNLGKDYANTLDDEFKNVEKQPKTSVLLYVVKEVDGKHYQLVSRRLKHPYFGKVGRLTGKVQFGETISDAAKRELYEETGLITRNPILETVYHKLRHDQNNTCVQDVIFYRFFINDTTGVLIPNTPWQDNIWISREGFENSFENNSELDFFEDYKFTERTEPTPFQFIETVAEEDGF